MLIPLSNYFVILVINETLLVVFRVMYETSRHILIEIVVRIQLKSHKNMNLNSAINIRTLLYLNTFVIVLYNFFDFF
jgi:hypothetical protein